MLTKMELLISNFQTLKGDTLQDKRKSFNLLLNQIEQELTTNQDLNYFVTALKPKTKLEEIFKVEILVRFQRYDALLEILKSGNVILIRKVLNCWRFFETAFTDVDAVTLVDELFASTSFSTRMKIITRLATTLKDDVQADSYFKAIEQKYGLKIASVILPACSLTLIKLTVGTFKVKLCARQLLNIFRKHHEFLEFYFDAYYKDKAYKNLSPEYDKVIKHVAKVDEGLFWKLVEKYEFDVKFGRHMSSYMYDPKFEKKYMVENFNVKRVYALVKNDERKLYDYIMALYPKSVSYFYFAFANRYRILQKVIKCLPKYRRFAIIDGCFRKMYGKDLCEYYGDRMSDEVLEIIPAEKRKEIVAKKIFDDESFIYMWPTHVAIPLLEERINYTNDENERCTLIVQLFKTCSFNDDLEALVKVLKYVRNKFKKHSYITSVFLIQLSYWPQQSKLKDDHWSHIVNILKPLADDSGIYWHSMVAYFKHMVKFNRQPDDFIKLFIKTISEARSSFFWMSSYREFDRKCIEHAALLIPQLFEGNEYHNAAIWLLTGMVYHNGKTSSRKILLSDYPQFVQVAKASLTKEYCSEEMKILRYCVRFEHDRDEEYDRLFWQHYDQMHDGDVLLWYIRKKPLTLFQNIEHVIKCASPGVSYKQLGPIFKIIVLYAPSGTIQKIVDRALDSLKANEINSAQFFLIALSHFADGTYLEVAKQFYPPEDGKIDYERLDKNRLIIQEFIAKTLLTSQAPSAILQTLSEFCKGDYLKFTYGSLFSITARACEKDLPQFFDTLSNSGVSVRKHVVCLITSLCPKVVIENFLKRSEESEDHPTLRKTVFKNTLRYFVDNHNEAFWNLLQTNIRMIHKDDCEAYDCLIRLEKFPYNYVPKYIQYVYEILTKHPSKQIQSKKWNLLREIPETVFANLSNEFLERVISDTLFTENCSEFWLSCVFSTAGEKQKDLLLFSLDLFEDYYKRNLSDKFSKEAIQNIHSFISGFCKRSVISNPCEIIVKDFVEFWWEVTKSKVFCEERLQLQLTHSYLTCHSEDKFSEFGTKANELLIQWMKKHGDDIVYLFAEKLKALLETVTKSEDAQLAMFLERFCRVNESVYNYIVAMKVLSEHEISSQFDAVMTIFRNCNIPGLRLRFGKFLKTLILVD